MENTPKARSPLGTYIVVEDRFGCAIWTLQDWLEGKVKGRIHVVSLTRGPLKSWVRAWQHRRRLEQNQKPRSF